MLQLLSFLSKIILYITNFFPIEKFEKENIVIDGKSYNLLVAKTFLQKMRGLSGIENLDNADGMIFRFSSPRRVMIWNSDTHFDLKLIWMRDGKIIGSDLLPSEKSGLIIKKSPEKVDEAVELLKQ